MKLYDMLRYWFAIGVLSVCYFVILYDTILHYFIYLFVILYDTMLFDTILYYITLSLLYDIILHHNISECVLPLYIYIYTHRSLNFCQNDPTIFSEHGYMRVRFEKAAKKQVQL